MGHSEVDVDFSVYSRLEKSKYWIQKIHFFRQIFQVGSHSSLNFPGISRVMEDNVMLFSDQRKSYMVKAKPNSSAMKSYEMVFRSRFLMSKVDPCLFMYRNVICVVYADDCLFWERSQYDIDNIMKYFKEDCTSYNWEYSKGESVSELLGIDIKTLDDSVFQFYQTGLILKVLEATRMEHCNGLPTKNQG